MSFDARILYVWLNTEGTNFEVPPPPLVNNCGYNKGNYCLVMS